MGSKTTVYKRTETRTPKPAASKIPDQAPNIARPYTHNGITNLPLTEAQLIVRLDSNSIHAAPSKAVAELRAKCPSYCRRNARLCTGLFAFRVLYREKPSRNGVPSALLLSRKRVALLKCVRVTRANSRNAVDPKTENIMKGKNVPTPT